MAALREIALILAQGLVHLGEVAGWGVRVDCFQSSDWSVDPHFIGKLTTRPPLLLGAMHLQDLTGRGNLVEEEETTVVTARAVERGVRKPNLIQRRKVSFLLVSTHGLPSLLLKQCCYLLLWDLLLIIFLHWRLFLLVVALNTSLIIGVLLLPMTGSSMLSTMVIRSL